jgi:hypothetical protein
MKKKFLSYQLSSYELRKGGCVPGNKEKKKEKNRERQKRKTRSGGEEVFRTGKKTARSPEVEE